MHEPHLDRRLFLKGTAVTGAALALGATAAPTASAAPGGFPDYTY
ncbi:twin-arginine translocation signal domain-containing protein, partial [Streptomyces violaceoruber]